MKTELIIDSIVELPHIVTWHDIEPTNACGWIVIDSLYNNTASGGVFMHPEATLEEVKGLAKAMTCKNMLQEPPLGGAKGGIQFDHKHPDANEVLKRFLIAHKEYISKIWSTGADLNTNNQVIHSVISNELNLPSGFVSVSNMLSKFYNIENRLDYFLSYISLPVAKYFTLAEYATGYSVATCIAKLCPSDIRISIQGFGSVGRSLGYVLHENRFGKVVSIIEKDYFIYHENGLNIDKLLAIRQRLIQDQYFSDDNYLAEIEKEEYSIVKRNPEQSNEDFLANSLSAVNIDLFCPCAVRYAITGRILSVLTTSAFKRRNSRNFWVISGANNVFAPAIEVVQLIKYGITVLPEWLANCGNTLLYNELLKPRNFKFLFEECTSIINQRIEYFLRQATEIAKLKNITLFEACYVAINEILKKLPRHTNLNKIGIYN